MLNEKIRAGLLELSSEEQKEAIQLLENEIIRRRKASALESIAQIAMDAGLDLTQLRDLAQMSDVLASDRESETDKRHYAHPKRPDLTWNGRGRHPYWFKDLLREGYTPDMLLVDRDN